MKKNLLFLFLTFSCNLIFGQTAYIQVTGEPNLSVYLNNLFKGKTTAEFNGCIIENVPAGRNLIKIVKDGFTPYEEYITVKSGEVFAYKVKPFTKYIVNISEEGNTGETDKKATIETGNLIIQSVPIEIKITIPDIEGINNSSKTKDKWLADKIPAGTYKITFTFNQKVINKTIVILGNNTTSVFVNMLSGDFQTKNSLDEINEKKRLEKLKNLKVSNFCDSLFNIYKFKPRMNEAKFWNYNLEANNMKNSRKCKTSNKTDGSSYSLFTEHGLGPCYISFDEKGEIIFYSYYLIKGQILLAQEYFKNIVLQIESRVPEEFIRRINDNYNGKIISIYYPKYNIEINYNMCYDSKSSLTIDFGVLDR